MSGLAAAADLVTTAFAQEADVGEFLSKGPELLFAVPLSGLLRLDELPASAPSGLRMPSGVLVGDSPCSEELLAGLSSKDLGALKPAGTEPLGAGDAMEVIWAALCCTAATHCIPAAERSS